MHRREKSIKAIAFDVGGVITPIEPWEGWTPTSDQRNQIKSVISEIAKSLQVSPNKDFRAADLERELTVRLKNIPTRHVQRIISCISNPDNELLDLISRLCNQYAIYGLSNAPFGWTELRRKLLGLDRHFKRFFVSYEIDVRKPDKDFFLYFLKNTDLLPEECLFVDDKKENVDAAIRLGFRGYVYDSAKSLKNYLIKSALIPD